MSFFSMKHDNCPTCRCTEPPLWQTNPDQSKDQHIEDLERKLAVCVEALREVKNIAERSRCDCLYPCDCASGAIFFAKGVVDKALYEVPGET